MCKYLTNFQQNSKVMRNKFDKSHKKDNKIVLSMQLINKVKTR